MPYPEQEKVLKDLVLEGHEKLKDEPLLIAIYYDSKLVDSNEECLFEVADNFGFNEVSEEKEIFQIQFGPAAGLPLPFDRRLRLLLTNPLEFDTAVKNSWPQIADLKNAIARNEYKVLYKRSDDSRPDSILRVL